MDAIFPLSSVPKERRKEEGKEGRGRLVSYASYARFMSMALATHALHVVRERQREREREPNKLGEMRKNTK